MIKLLNKYKILGLPVLLILLTLFINNKPVKVATHLTAPSSIEWEDNIQKKEEPIKEVKEQIIEQVKQVPIYICGQVNNPGVYYVLEDTLVYEVVALAGGLTQEAYPEGINLARQIITNEKIVVPKQGEKIDKTDDSYENVVYGNKLININTAIESELETLPGIGTVKAKQIMDYRNSNGLFKKLEEIKDVPGIGDKTFDSIKDMITIE